MSVIEQSHQTFEQYYKRNSTVAIIENAMFSLIRLGLSPYTILPFYLKQLTDSPFLISLIPAIFVLGFAVPQLFMVKFLQRTRSRKHILIFSSLAQRVCILGILVLTIFQNHLSNPLTILLFFSLYLLYNISRGCWSLTWIDFLGCTVLRNRGKIIGIGNFFGGFLNLLGIFFLTRLLTILPYPQAITAILSFSFIGSLVSFGAIACLRDIHPADVEKEVDFQPGLSGVVKNNLPSGDFQRYLGWRSVITAMEMMLAFYTLYGLEKFNLPLAYVGIFAAILTVSDAIMNPIWGWLGDKFGYLFVVTAASFLGGLGALLSAFSPNSLVFSFVFLLNGMMLSGQQQGNINIVYEYAVKTKVPAYTAINQIILSLLSGLAPVIGGFITGSIGYAGGGLVAGSIGMIGVAGMVMNVRSPRLEKRKEETRQEIPK
jgi:MFS family permease